MIIVASTLSIIALHMTTKLEYNAIWPRTETV